MVAVTEKPASGCVCVCENIRVSLLRKGLEWWPVPAANPLERQSRGGRDCD